MLHAFAPRLAFVDVETTGSSPARERLTEVGIVRVDFDGDAVRVDEWASLVNPGVPIPADIQWLTGITNEMVRHAPPFADVAQTLFDRLEGAIFVAHNARYDYGFIRAEFDRVGLPYSAKTLCTVRLSRYLYPDRAPHTLDALIDRFNLEGEQRHRALGDARVLWRWLQKLADRHPPAEIEYAVKALLRQPGLPSNLPPDALDEVPHAPGVYLFYGLNEHPIYVGKSIDLRTRVASHFSAARELQLSQEIHRLEWEQTAGEFGALLRESELIKTRLPAHNIAARRKSSQVLASVDDMGRVSVTKAAALDRTQLLTHLDRSYGPFSSRASVRRWLIGLAAEHRLCLKTMGIERRSKALDNAPCFNYQLRRCRGACVGTESREEHSMRLKELMRPSLLPAWPYATAIAIVERDAARFQEQWHVFDQWCWLGTVRTLEAASALVQSAPRLFEADAARLAVQALSGTKSWQLQTVELHRSPPNLHAADTYRVPAGAIASGGT